MLLLDGPESADPRAADYPEAFGIARPVQLRIRQHLIRSADGILRKEVHPTDFLARQIVLAVEAFDLACDLAGIVGGIKARDRADPTTSLDQIRPERLQV